jgi:hypothetical protein
VVKGGGASALGPRCCRATSSSQPSPAQPCPALRERRQLTPQAEQARLPDRSPAAGAVAQHLLDRGGVQLVAVRQLQVAGRHRGKELRGLGRQLALLAHRGGELALRGGEVEEEEEEEGWVGRGASSAGAWRQPPGTAAGGPRPEAHAAQAGAEQAPWGGARGRAGRLAARCNRRRRAPSSGSGPHLDGIWHAPQAVHAVKVLHQQPQAHVEQGRHPAALLRTAAAAGLPIDVLWAGRAETWPCVRKGGCRAGSSAWLGAPGGAASGARGQVVLAALHGEQGGGAAQLGPAAPAAGEAAHPAPPPPAPPSGSCPPSPLPRAAVR